MAKKRIVVTGMGIVSCFGTDVETFYDDLINHFMNQFNSRFFGIILPKSFHPKVKAKEKYFECSLQ